MAPFENDGEWYRASITNIYPERTIGLYYIDFGDRSRLNIDQVKKIRLVLFIDGLLAFSIVL